MGVLHRPEPPAAERAPERLAGKGKVQLPLAPAATTLEEAGAAPKVKFKLEQHTFLPTGLLVVNPRGRHPIYDLIARAAREWEAKLARQSRTLPAAVEEYRRRYGRAPPRGFGAWWAYVERHGVQLPDEYDQIARDLEPFWGVGPKEARAMQGAARGRGGTYTLVSSREGKIALGSARLEKGEEEARGLERARAQLELIRGEIVKATGEWEATFNAGDTPRELVSWEMDNDRRWKAKAGQGTFLCAVAGWKKQAYTGWAAACSPTSPLRQGWPPVPELPLQPHEPKTFVHSHQAAMDACAHPSLVHTSGLLLGQGRGPQLPELSALIFGSAKTSLHADVLIVPSEGWVEDVHDDVEWEAKQDERLVWRGSNTGLLHTPENRWEASQRIRFVEMTGVHDNLLQYPVPVADRAQVLLPQTEDTPVGAPQPRPQSWMNELLTDAAFVRGPVQCVARECDKLWEQFEFRSTMPLAAQYGYKYAFDLDGNGPSMRFKRLLTSRSLVLQATVFPQWYADRIQPWVHYVPVQVDLSDLYDILTFFAGDVASGGRGGHDALARQIAYAGREWSTRFWRKEDMVAYTWRLMLEYGRIVSDQRAMMDFELA
ncbi:glycosyltransferase family 90 protein [Calocera viscosa TUFC12733]|uniref:Glycosyltransferase family 90 protein n=1 Tax=Calocera viscosa (strain TUFC12733) TaxID=1330018 RepID=A0A167GQF6_CALVF|nr:glycosyltransferase family 90 protein [Calocera viscosa TUFC12733]